MEVLVGKRSIFVYIVFATQFLKEKGKVKIKARGRAISKAVDVAEFVKRQNKVKKEKIEIGTEEIDNKGISYIVITLEV